MKNLDELNTKHDSVEFQYKISETSIFFMDTAFFLWIQTDRQSFLHINSKHLKSLQKSIPYSQAL